MHEGTNFADGAKDAAVEMVAKHTWATKVDKCVDSVPQIAASTTASSKSGEAEGPDPTTDTALEYAVHHVIANIVGECCDLAHETAAPMTAGSKPIVEDYASWTEGAAVNATVDINGVDDIMGGCFVSAGEVASSISATSNANKVTAVATVTAIPSTEEGEPNSAFNLATDNSTQPTANSYGPRATEREISAAERVADGMRHLEAVDTEHSSILTTAHSQQGPSTADSTGTAIVEPVTDSAHKVAVAVTAEYTETAAASIAAPVHSSGVPAIPSPPCKIGEAHAAVASSVTEKETSAAVMAVAEYSGAVMTHAALAGVVGLQHFAAMVDSHTSKSAASGAPVPDAMTLAAPAGHLGRQHFAPTFDSSASKTAVSGAGAGVFSQESDDSIITADQIAGTGAVVSRPNPDGENSTSTATMQTDVMIQATSRVSGLASVKKFSPAMNLTDSLTEPTAHCPADNDDTADSGVMQKTCAEDEDTCLSIAATDGAVKCCNSGYVSALAVPFVFYKQNLSVE